MRLLQAGANVPYSSLVSCGGISCNSGIANAVGHHTALTIFLEIVHGFLIGSMCTNALLCLA